MITIFLADTVSVYGVHAATHAAHISQFKYGRTITVKAGAFRQRAGGGQVKISFVNGNERFDEIEAYCLQAHVESCIQRAEQQAVSL